jgi:hypothetical protein
MRASLGPTVPLVVALLLTGCGGSDAEGGSTSPPVSSTPSSTAQVLELGKTDVALEAGEVRSPAGFEPALSFDVPAGWTSVHRYADVFDLGLPDPDSDGPLAVVVVSVAPEADAAGALAAVSGPQPHAEVTEATLLGSTAQQLDVVGGHGSAYTTRDGSVSLDAGRGQRLRLLAADTAGGALVVAVLVPDGSDDAMAQAMQVVATARPVTP